MENSHSSGSEWSNSLIGTSNASVKIDDDHCDIVVGRDHWLEDLTDLNNEFSRKASQRLATTCHVFGLNDFEPGWHTGMPSTYTEYTSSNMGSGSAISKSTSAESTFSRPHPNHENPTSTPTGTYMIETSPKANMEQESYGKSITHSLEVETQHSYTGVPNLDSHPTENLNTESLDALFESSLSALTQVFTNRATTELLASQCASGQGSSSSSSSPSSSSDATSRNTTTSTSTSTSGSASSSNWKRKLINSGNGSFDGNEESGGDDKRQKIRDKPSDKGVDLRLSCPFRKNCPSKYGLGNPRYLSCATGSWKDIGHLKDSHIYRVHLAQCCGCKKNMKTEQQFEEHRLEAVYLDPGSACIGYEGLFEPQIIALKALKLKGLGMAASWDLLYTALYPKSDTASLPSPWYTPPCDGQCHTGPDKELQHILPEEIAAFMETQFMALSRSISSNKPQILNFLMDRLRKRQDGVVSDIEAELARETSLEQSGATSGLDREEGFSVTEFSLVDLPIEQPLGLNTRGTFQTPWLESNMDTALPNMLQNSDVTPNQSMNLPVTNERQDYQTGWLDGQQEGHAAGWMGGREEGYTLGWKDGHENGYLDGQREGYKAGKKAAEEGGRESRLLQ
ncbi:hypothetical protein VTL71DRAFT_3345 [Oculimacula yallundae]|uniref:Uncharacterized protein n=1 Tax=Oculimacula yallundae TaxID=86028 RepID=A0ABR4C6Y7_9HELO